MNFIIENFKNPKIVLIVLGLTAVIVSSVMLVGYGSYLKTAVVGGNQYIPETEKSCDLTERPYSAPLSANQVACDTYCKKYLSAKVSGSGTRTATENSSRIYISNFSPCAQSKFSPGGGSLSYIKTITCKCSGCKTKAVCQTGYDCRNGKCVKEIIPTCTEDDGGINLMKKSTTTDNSGSYTDYCDGNKIIEYYCRNGVAKKNYPSLCSRYGQVGQNMICDDGACKEGTTPEVCDGKDNDGDGLIDEGNLCQSGYDCKNGKCVKEIIPTCTEDDGGINVYKKSTTKDNSGSYTDYCDKNTGKLIEYYCKDGVAKKSYSVDCSRYGQAGQNMICEDGACVKGEPEPTCEADGKCKADCRNQGGDPDCLCSQYNPSGFICQTNETCLGISLKHNKSGTCCSIACAPAAIYSISGRIISSEDISSSRIAINLTGTSSASTATDSSGSYSFNNLTNGSYAIAPNDGTWIISPTSQNAIISNSNVSGINFTAIKKECNSGETKKHICPDGTEVDWCVCNENYKMVCIDSPENNCPVAPATCEYDGKCKPYPGCSTGDLDCLCSQHNPGFICQENETCLGITLDHNYTEGQVCCSIACEGAAADFQTADLNCDGSVNLADSAILMSFWGKKNWSETDSCQSPDIYKDEDGAVNLADSAIMMSQWTEMTF